MRVDMKASSVFIGNVRVVAVSHSIHCATRGQAVKWNAISLGNVAPLPRVGVKKRDHRLARFPDFFIYKTKHKAVSRD